MDFQSLWASSSFDSEGQLSDANAGHAGDLNANARDRRVVETTQLCQMYLETEHRGLDVFFDFLRETNGVEIWNLFFLGGGGVL